MTVTVSRGCPPPTTPHRIAHIPTDSPDTHTRRTARRSAQRQGVAVELSSSSDYRYVTPSTISDSNTGETGRAHRSGAHTSDFPWSARPPSAAATAPSTKETATTANPQLLILRVAIAMEIPASHRMWPTTN